MGYLKEGEERGGGSPFYQTKYDSVIGLLLYVHPAEILAAQPSARKKETFLAKFLLIISIQCHDRYGEKESTASAFSLLLKRVRPALAIQYQGQSGTQG
jgi:hypothetical protein